MKLIFVLIATIIFHVAFSQKKKYKFFNPSSDAAMGIEGQAWPGEVKDFYDRLPARAEKIVRKPLWDLSKNSAGLQLRFITDAPEIIIKYIVAGNLQMPHMPATGVSGVDLYAKNNDGKWLWAAGKYSFADTISYRFTNLSLVQREYTLYLPLYNSVKWMEIGVPEENSFELLSARKDKPIVVYGTSIAQGACASRPGLAWTNILGRRLNRPVINLGFSGNGRMEKEIIDLLAEIDAKFFVLDCLPNMTAMPENELKKRIVEVVLQLQNKKPGVPILLTEHDGYTQGEISPVKKKEYTDANKALRQVTDSLFNKGIKNIYLLTKDEISQDIETMVDGTHPNDIGMMRYADAYEKKIKKIFIDDNTSPTGKASLIPLPQQLRWDKGSSDLKKFKAIVISSPLFKNAAKYLELKLAEKNVTIPVTVGNKNAEWIIELQLGKVKTPQLADEDYHLKVDQKKILLIANTAHGIFNGIQTLLQLMEDNSTADACEITDWPAFAWRGYMVDVGRNYMSMKLLKQQIDVMAKYKLNVFHFHPTEDVAWRIAIKQYPQLTAAENMLRNKGQYYSEANLKELIAYCKERYITFLPEIDMPGHSAAFRRAMNTDMQSDSGLLIIKNILKEICTTYNVRYIHIGADEVKITNQNFIPEITSYIENFGKKVIGWHPGGNFTNNTIRQLWKEDGSTMDGNFPFKFIDSRHLYLNHFDPLESVVTIFNRKISNKEKGDTSALGGIICLWNDRAVAKEEDLLEMNPVYPSMLAFAERSWRGGGQNNWIANVSDGNEKDFIEFEKRLLQNKKLYFKNKLFPYVKQSDMVWQLFGPYDNGGDLSKKFTPELSSWDSSKPNPYKKVTGGTIVLRHWWYPLIRGAIDEPKENTTWYAFTKIWCDEDGEKDFWIGFNNLSRSPATDSPPVGAWDSKGSAAWVNGKLIEPPQWNRGGQKGNSEIPLTDEGYEYREPTNFFLKKGWNTVLLKAPVGSFKAKNGQNPVKWMFTFVPVASL